MGGDGALALPLEPLSDVVISLLCASVPGDVLPSLLHARTRFVRHVVTGKPQHSALCPSITMRTLSTREACA